MPDHTVAVFDTKPYDREYLTHAPAADQLIWRFHEFRLTAETAATAAGASSVCIFVNDHADRPTLEILASHGVRLIALPAQASITSTSPPPNPSASPSSASPPTPLTPSQNIPSPSS